MKALVIGASELVSPIPQRIEIGDEAACKIRSLASNVERPSAFKSDWCEDAGWLQLFLIASLQADAKGGVK